MDSSSSKSNTGLILAILFSGLIISGSLGFLGYQMYQQNQNTAQANNAADEAELKKLLGEIEQNSALDNVTKADILDDDAMMGNPNAKVTLVEFSDYQCPFCERHFQQTYPLLKSTYVDTGKISYVYRDFPLGFHPGAAPAAQAAECARAQAGDDAYFSMHSKIFNNQSQLSSSDLGQIFSGFAAQLGLSVSEFNTCFNSQKFAQEVDADYNQGGALGITGTPGFILIKADGSKEIISGAQPFSVFQQKIDAALSL